MKIPPVRKISIPARSEIKVIPADKPGKSIGWTVTEHVGVGVFNPRGVTRLGIINLFSHVFAWGNYDTYYDETDSTYYVINPDAVFNLGPNGEKLPTLIRDATKAKRLADYVFKPDGEIVKDRDGEGPRIFRQMKKTIDVHQVMVS